MIFPKIVIGSLYTIAVLLLIKGIEGDILLAIAGIIVMLASLFYTHLYTIQKRYGEHFCLNQIMEGDYECEVCNPK